MLKDTVRGRYRLSLLTSVIVICSIAYIVFPYDLVPDHIPVTGWIDDVLVFYFMLRTLKKETHRYNRHKAMERKHPVC